MIALAIDLVRAKFSWLYRWNVDLDLLLDVWTASPEARSTKHSWAFLPQPPYDSTARGTQDHPNSTDFWSAAVCFITSAALAAAAPAVLPAAFKMFALSGETTFRSRVTGLPWSQSKTRMSAGREWEWSWLRPKPVSTWTWDVGPMEWLHQNVP